MISFENLSCSSVGTLGHSKHLAFNSTRGVSSFRLCLFSRKTVMNHLSYRFSRDTFSGDRKGSEVEKERKVQKNASDEDDPRGEERGISGIHVPRQKYISVSKAELLQAILEMFELKEDADNFLKVSVCLDSIFHAEHKDILEEMRSYYSPHLQDRFQSSNFSTLPWQATSGQLDVAASNGSMSTIGMEANFPSNAEDEKPLDNLELGRFFESLIGKGDGKSSMDSLRIADAIRFQQSFMKLLHNAQFEELSAQDLLLANALNTDYLLTLPIYVDWKRASESHAIIFRRGYATERQRGLLVAEKLDYLQSKLLQEIFFILSRPLKEFGKWLYETLKGFNNAQSVTARIDAVKLWLKDQYSLEGTWSNGHNFFRNQLRSDIIGDSDLPIWLAAQRAVPRYEGFLSVIGPRRRLMKKLLTWVGLVPATPEVSVDFCRDAHSSETDSRQNLQRITLSNLWEPASKESCGNNVWKMLKTALSILFSRSILQEPAFEELIILYTDELNQREDTDNVLQLYLKIYERIPIPDLPVIFPHKKLSFRILDTVRLDVASILGLLAFFLNYKFEDILSSPSAVLLDVIGTTALMVYVSRVVLGYKQTWDRYQLLVNKTLYEKTLASGFGSVHFLLDASELQQYKEAILLYAILLHPEKYEVLNRKSIGAECEMFLFDKFNLQIDMPIDNAMDTLIRLDLVSEFPVEGNLKTNVVPCSKAYEHLRKRWNSLLDLGS